MRPKIENLSLYQELKRANFNTWRRIGRSALDHEISNGYQNKTDVTKVR